MNRLIIIALFVFAVPAAAFANTLDLSNGGNLGSSASTSGPLTSGQPFSVTDQLLSGLGTVTFTTAGLVSVSSGEFSFSGGTVEVLGNSSQVLFQDTFGSGTVTNVAGFILLSSNAGLDGVSVQLVITPSGFVKGDVMVAPEPGTLGLLGTGLVGLAGVLRRKLPLGRCFLG